MLKSLVLNCISHNKKGDNFVSAPRRLGSASTKAPSAREPVTNSHRERAISKFSFSIPNVSLGLWIMSRNWTSCWSCCSFVCCENQALRVVRCSDDNHRCAMTAMGLFLIFVAVTSQAIFDWTSAFLHPRGGIHASSCIKNIKEKRFVVLVKWTSLHDRIPKEMRTLILLNINYSKFSRSDVVFYR